MQQTITTSGTSLSFVDPQKLFRLLTQDIRYSYSTNCGLQTPTATAAQFRTTGMLR